MVSLHAARITKHCVVAFSIALASGSTSAQLFKCLSATGKVTYSGQKCSDLGLKDAGEVKERIQSAPGDRAAAAAASRKPPPAPAAPAKTPEPAAPAAKTDEPERRCFTVKTAKGTVTRCGEKTEDE